MHSFTVIEPIRFIPVKKRQMDNRNPVAQEGHLPGDMLARPRGEVAGTCPFKANL